MNKQPLDFDQLRLKHLQFKSRLRSLLYGAQIDEQPVVSEHDCPVGRWIQDQGLPACGHVPEMHRLERVHVELHARARHLLGRYKAGEVEAARGGLAGVEELAAELLGLVADLEAKTQTARPPKGTAGIRENVALLGELQRANEALEERIRTQTVELQRTQERFDLVAKATNDAIWDWNLVTDQIWWNQGFTTLFGYQAHEIEPGIESWYGRIHPDDQQRVVTGIHAVIDHGGRQWADEYRFRKADGSYASVLDRGYALHDAGGKPYRMLGSMQDVTERKRWEAALLESRQQLETLSEVIPQLVWTSSADGYVNYYNGQWYAYTGLDFEQSSGEGWAGVFHPDDLPGLVRHWTDALRTGQPYQTEARLKRVDGAYRWFLIRALPLKDEKGNVTRWFGTDTDIHERKEAEQALQQLSREVVASNMELARANAQLVRTNVDLDNFVYTASHDLKAPIVNIEGLLKALVRQLSSPGAGAEGIATTISFMQESVERFKRTIAHLTEVAKLQQENNQPPTPVRLAGLIAEVQLDLAALVREAGAEVVVDADPDLTVEFSEKNLRSIVYNLLANAVKYRSPARRPLVRITARRTGTQVVLTVADNGLGIDLAKGRQEKLFAMFQRLHTHVEGTGLGLYMVKKMLENAGGTIEVESRVGEGSAFRVYFKE